MDQWAIDVSRWQGVIDWAKVAAAGVAGAWIKVGGSDQGMYADSRGQINMAEATIPFGTYYYAVPRLWDAEVQADHAVSVGYGQGELWPALDLEENRENLTNAELDEWVMEFCGRVKEVTGRESLLYTGYGVGVGHTEAHMPHCPLWIANYGLNRPGTTPPTFDPRLPPAWTESGWSVWQFNSVTTVAGISGNVDQNTVEEGFWDQMMAGDETNGEEDMAALTGIVRTKVGSQWALEHIGRNDVGAYVLTIEGSRTCRWLDGDTLDVELFWAGKGIEEVWEVEDNFLAWPRYAYEGSENCGLANGGRIAGTITGEFQTSS